MIPGEEQIRASFASAAARTGLPTPGETSDALIEEVAREFDRQAWQADGSSVLSILRRVQVTRAGKTADVSTFQGRRLDEVSHVDVPARPPLPTPSDLLPVLRAHLESAGLRPEVGWVIGYLGVLTAPAIRELGHHRSIDAHACAMIGAERLAQSATPIPAAWDAAAFEWLHEVACGERPPVDWVREAAQRRHVRHRLRGVPVEAVMGAVCEVPLPPAFVEAVGRAAPDAALTMDDVVAFWRAVMRLANHPDSPPESSDWLERIDALGHDHRVTLDGHLTHGAATGNLVGWLLRNGAVVDRATVQFAALYVISVIEELEQAGSTVSTTDELLAVHLRSMSATTEGTDADVSLDTELALWAWMLHSGNLAGSLLPYLQTRRRHARREWVNLRLGEADRV